MTRYVLLMVVIATALTAARTTPVRPQDSNPGLTHIDSDSAAAPPPLSGVAGDQRQGRTLNLVPDLATTLLQPGHPTRRQGTVAGSGIPVPASQYSNADFNGVNSFGNGVHGPGNGDAYDEGGDDVEDGAMFPGIEDESFLTRLVKMPYRMAVATYNILRFAAEWRI